jgi:hypothetical protein
MIVENSRVLAMCNRVVGVEMEAVTLGPVILFEGKAEDEVLVRHECIHAEQYKDLGYIGFPFVYVYDYIRNRMRGMSSHDAYTATRAEKEAYNHESDRSYLEQRKRWRWLCADN